MVKAKHGYKPPLELTKENFREAIGEYPLVKLGHEEAAHLRMLFEDAVRKRFYTELNELDIIVTRDEFNLLTKHFGRYFLFGSREGQAEMELRFVDDDGNDEDEKAEAYLVIECTGRDMPFADPPIMNLYHFISLSGRIGTDVIQLLAESEEEAWIVLANDVDASVEKTKRYYLLKPELTLWCGGPKMIARLNIHEPACKFFHDDQRDNKGETQ